MRLNRATLAAKGATIMGLDPHKTQFAMQAMLYGSSSINATAQVDTTLSDLGNIIPVTVSQSSTTITVTFPTTNPHTLGGTKDYVTLTNTGNSTLDGTWPIASVSSDTVLTITSGTSQSVTAVGNACPIRFCETLIASASVSATTPAIPAVSATTTQLALTTHSGLILKCTTYTAGTMYLDVRQAGI